MMGPDELESVPATREAPEPVRGFEISEAQLWQKTANFLGYLQDYCNQEARRQRRDEMAKQLRQEIELKEREIDRLYGGDGARKSDRY